MSERALRDEIEALFGELKAQRSRLEISSDVELAEARGRLTKEVEELTARVQALKHRRDALAEQTRVRAQETLDAVDELGRARSEIGRRQPLGDPLASSKSNWETADQPGCAIGVWLVLCVALGAAGWWLQ